MNKRLRAAAVLAGGIIAVSSLAPAAGVTVATVPGVPVPPVTGLAEPAQAVAAAPPAMRTRASLSVAVTSEATGRLLIRVTSNAQRVLLTWLTPANTKRSTVIRIRNGRGAGYLPKGSTQVSAKALATKKLRASLPATSKPADAVIVSSVTFLEATPTSPTTVSLKWVNAEGAARIVVRRAVGAEAPSTTTSGTDVPLANPTATLADDTGLTPGTLYSYSVFAIYPEGTAAAPAVATASTPATTTTPAPAPTPATTTTPTPTPTPTPTTTTADCAQTIRLGQSVQGRAINACRLRGSDDAAAHTVLVVGNMHGIEPAGLKVVARLKAMNITGRKANVWVIDTINPDGTRILSRGNAHKIDLNRNFPAKGWRVQGIGTVVYGGRAAGSEPETKALMSAMAQIRPTVVVVFHQQLNQIDCTPLRPETLSQTLGKLSGYRVLSPPHCLPNWVGQFTTWANETYSATSAVTFELEASPPASRLDRVAEAMVQLGTKLPAVTG